MTPFFLLSIFLCVAQNISTSQRNTLALKVTISIFIICTILLFFGEYIFLIFGITLDAFRIGAGALLFLSAIELVKGDLNKAEFEGNPITLAVVPLAIPITIGPATIGTLLVMGVETLGFKDMITTFISIILAITSLGIILLMSSKIEQIIGKNGIVILSKLTGLILSALSAQMIFTGIQGFLK